MLADLENETRKEFLFFNDMNQLCTKLDKYLNKYLLTETEEESIKFRVSIGRSTVIPQTQKVGKTLFETHSTHKITDEYRAIATELEERISKLETAQSLTLVQRDVVNG